MDGRISEALGWIALLALVSISAPGASCFEPVYCRGGSTAACFQHCVGLSEHIVTQDPAASITHPECLVRCDDSCSRVCGETAADQAQPSEPDEAAPEDSQTTVSSRPHERPQFKNQVK